MTATKVEELIAELRAEIVVARGWKLPPRERDLRAADLIASLNAEVEGFRSERSYVVGWNDGFEHAHENLKFPTMLRKMWSGQEVQNWIDEQARAALSARK